MLVWTGLAISVTDDVQRLYPSTISVTGCKVVYGRWL